MGSTTHIDPSGEEGAASAPRYLALVTSSQPPTSKVLVVEDDDDDAHLIRRCLFLSAPHLQVEVVATAQAALFKLRGGGYRAAIIDYRLGTTRGTELIERCRASGVGTPMILLTGQGGADVDLEAMQKGACDYLEKSTVTPELLERSLRYAVEQATTRQALVAARNRFEAAIRGSNDGIWDLDLGSGTLFLSPRFKSMLGLEIRDGGDHLGTWFSRVHDDDLPRVEDAIQAASDGRSEGLNIEHRILHADGTWLWVLLRGKLQRDEEGAPVRLAGSQTDITVRRNAEEHTRHQALHDSLTGLANRALLADRLDHLVRRLRRHPEAGFSILYLDLDDFKPVNDEHGHAAGDIVLMEVAARLRDAVRAVDTVARIGGDEFVLLLERCVTAEDAEKVSSNVREAISAPIEIEAAQVTIGVSIGTRLVADPVDDVLTLLSDADRSMYAAKAGRSGRVLGLVQRKRELRPTMQDWLRDAIANETLGPHFQPIVCAQSRTVLGYEALARWTHQGESISPGTFVPLARSAGLLDALGETMLRQACRWVAGREEDDLWVSVNVDASSLASPEIVETVRAALEEAGVDGSRLRLELTEHEELPCLRAAASHVEALAALGVELSLDDFGTGHCGLGALLELPNTCIKLDRSLIIKLGSCEATRTVVGSLVKMAHALGRSVVAEGVETAAQWRAATAQGVDLAQGYLFGRPQATWPQPRFTL